MQEQINSRQPEYPINSNILCRQSKRSMSGESISKDELMSLFEAAKWAPSANNNQLTRFVYAQKNTSFWNPFFELLAEGNKIWCQNADSLIIIISRKNSYHNNRPQKTHSFEAGSAFQNLAIQGTSSGLVVHPMAGFDYGKASQMLGLDENWVVECMVAVGKPGEITSLPEDLQQAEKPSGRKPLEELVFEGAFNE